MNLQEFISTALAEIVAGVASARDEAKKHGSNVGPMRVYGNLKAAKIVIQRRLLLDLDTEPFSLAREPRYASSRKDYVLY